MARCRLKAAVGDALNAVLVAAGHNIRLLLRAMAALLRRILAALLSAVLSETLETRRDPGLPAAA